MLEEYGRGHLYQPQYDAYQRMLEKVPPHLVPYFSLLDNFQPDFSQYKEPNNIQEFDFVNDQGFCSVEKAVSEEELAKHKEKFIRKQKVAFLEEVTSYFLPNLSKYVPPKEVLRRGISKDKVPILYWANDPTEEELERYRRDYINDQKINRIKKAVDDHNKQMLAQQQLKVAENNPAKKTAAPAT